MKYFIFLVAISIPLFCFGGTTGKLVGTVNDAVTGDPLIGANVFLIGTSLGAASNENGNYVILNIPPGVYQVRYSFVGYETVIVEDVRIIVDQTTTIDLRLNPGSLLLDEVVVTAESPLIQKDLTSTISVIRREDIESLPVARFTDLLELQAGVVGSGSRLHIRGGRTNEVAFLVDGMLVKDPLLGGLATQINNDAIQEMSLLSGTFNAEYGNAMSGIVNIVTRDGSEQYRGRVEVRTSEFGIDRYVQFGQNRFNGNLSGPLLHPSVRFFVSAERDRRGSYLPFGYDNSDTFFSKITLLQFSKARISVTNRGSKGKRQGYNHRWKYIPDQYLHTRTDSWHSVLNLTHTLANNLFYDLRISYFDQGYYAGVNKDTSEYLPVSERVYVSEAGNGFEFYALADPVELTDSRTSTVEVKGDVVWQIGMHNEIKTGIQYKKHRLRLFNIYDPKRNFPYINDYRTEPYEFAAYLQDKIEFPYLVINLGLRFDYVHGNVTYREDPLETGSLINVKARTQLSPRIGIAHPISERTKLHFAYGHFFQNPDFQYLYENSQYDLNVREPLFGQPNLDAQRTTAYEVGLAHQFTDHIALNVTAYYKDVTGLIGTRYFFPFEDGRYTGYTVYINEDYANIRGFEVNLDMKPTRFFFGGFTYTYSVAKGNASSETEHYPGTQKSTLLYYLNFDKTHVFNASGSFRLPKGEGPIIFGTRLLERMSASMIIRASSGYPYTPGGRDIGFVVKNSLRRPGTYTVDVKINKEIPLAGETYMTLFTEILNITNHRNILYVYSDTGEPDVTFVDNASVEFMRDPSNFGPPRLIRIGMGFSF
jgi:outer membrane receptor protein involved in Fe transport